MIGLTAAIIIYSAYQAVALKKKNMTREIVVSIGIALMALGLGFYYTSNPYEISFAGYVLKLLNLNK